MIQEEILMFKKIVAMVLIITLVAACLTGCGGSKEVTVASIQKAGKLDIATSPDFPPFESLTADGSVEGIEIEIMELICKELGVELL